LTLDDLEGHYCNETCIGCSASSLATAGLFAYNKLHCMRIFSPFMCCM